MQESDIATDPRQTDARMTVRQAEIETTQKPGTTVLDFGVDGVKRASATIFTREKLSVTMENMYGEKLVIKGDVRSLLEVTYAIDFAIEQATRREATRRAY